MFSAAISYNAVISKLDVLDVFGGAVISKWDVPNVFGGDII